MLPSTVESWVGELARGLNLREVDCIYSFATPLLVDLGQVISYSSKALPSPWQME